jgi:hypothetical protein
MDHVVPFYPEFETLALPDGSTNPDGFLPVVR